MKRHFFLALLASLTMFGAYAQDVRDDQSCSIQSHVLKRYNVFFDSGVSKIDYAYQRNADILYTMKEDIDATFKQDNAYPDSLLIISTSSPEGDAALNRKLAEERAANIKRVLLLMFPQMEKSVIEIDYPESSWDGLEQILRKNKDFPQAEQMLAILNGSLDDAAKEEALRGCTEGWNYLTANHLYSLRTSSITMKVAFDGEIDEYVQIEEVPSEPESVQEVQEQVPEVPAQVSEAPEQVQEMPEHDKAEQPAPVEIMQVQQNETEQPQKPVSEKEKKQLVFGVKTNLLYDLIAVPNIGAEFYLGSNWSVSGNWMHSWWHSDEDLWCWRTYGGDLAVRKWFGKASSERPLTGHHVGVYGQMLTYDFLIDKDGIIADKWNWAAGLEYGYSLPLAKRLNMDFTIGAGYHWGEFKEYIPLDGHYVWQATKRRHYIGPTKIEISLVWLIGGSDKLHAKGGRR